MSVINYLEAQVEDLEKDVETLEARVVFLEEENMSLRYDLGDKDNKIDALEMDLANLRDIVDEFVGSASACKANMRSRE